MVDLLNFIDDEAADLILPRLTAAVVPVSYLAIMHPASDLDPALLKAAQRWNQLAAQPVSLRSRADMTGFLAGLELVEPGLVTVPEWRPEAGTQRGAEVIPLYAVVARRTVTRSHVRAGASGQAGPGRRVRSAGGGVQDGADRGDVQAGLGLGLRQAQCLLGLSGKAAVVNGVLGVVRRAGVQDFEFLAAVAVGDHQHGQVGIRGQLDGQVTERSGREAGGLVPDLPGGRTAQDGLADSLHRVFFCFLPLRKPGGPGRGGARG